MAVAQARAPAGDDTPEEPSSAAAAPSARAAPTAGESRRAEASPASPAAAYAVPVWSTTTLSAPGPAAAVGWSGASARARDSFPPPADSSEAAGAGGLDRGDDGARQPGAEQGAAGDDDGRGGRGDEDRPPGQPSSATLGELVEGRSRLLGGERGGDPVDEVVRHRSGIGQGGQQGTHPGRVLVEGLGMEVVRRGHGVLRCAGRAAPAAAAAGGMLP